MGGENPGAGRNRASTERLRDLVGRLGAADPERPVGGGWTVGFALAHLAFWDHRQRVALELYARDGAFPEEDPAVNEALEAVAPLLRSGAAGAEAVRAAALLDETIETLTPSQWDEILAAGEGYAIERWRHRDEHIAQIEAAPD